MMIKRVSAMLLALVICMGVFSTTAFAYADETVDAADATETIEAIEATEPEDTDTNEPALTPDGNLTLVDDVGSADGESKQFITAVTKNGNYFYIIIDRDDDGDETVHFLNQVDEADLLKLMDEEEAAQYIDQTEEPVTKPEPEVTEPESEVTEPEPEEKDKPNMLPLIGVLAVALIGGGGFVFMKLKSKQKEKKAAKPDPDADYVDDDEDYGYVEEDDDDDNEPV